MPHAIKASSSANKSSARTVCDNSMMCSRAAKQISASAIGMITISAAVKLSPNDDRGDRGAAAGLAMGDDSVVIAPPR